MDLFFTLQPNLLTVLLGGILFLLLFIFLFVVKKTEYILYFFLIWFPLEAVVLKYTPIEYFSVLKYLPEFVLYGLSLGSFFQYFFKKGKLIPKNPLNLTFLLFFLVALISLLLNHYSVTIWALGLRQILRFSLVFFVILFMSYDKNIQKRLLQVGLSVIVFEAVLAILQYLSGGAFDRYLFSSEVVSVGGSALVGGAEQFWAPGTRVFATLGRYDRLGSLLALGLIGVFPFCLTFGKQKKSYWLYFFLILLGVLLTRSRASWIAAIVGIAVIGLGVLKDFRVKWGIALLGLFLTLYLGFSFLVSGVSLQVVDNPSSQTLSERLLEAVSFKSWKESYEGYGRIFFIVNTPRHVIATAPFFGVGPGNFGGGVAASLVNTAVYDRLKLPFGIQNQYGQIDNSWLSIWGELGTFGFLLWLMFFVLLVRMSFWVYTRGSEEESHLALALIGLAPALGIMGFFGPYFEFRALMCYFWMVAGLVALDWSLHKKKGNLLDEI